MAMRKRQPHSFRARGVTDAIDGSGVFPGAMKQLVNLIPDPNQGNLFVPRPASVQLSNFAGFNTPAALSALLIVGDFAYGMIASARNAGKDEPFIYNLATGAFVTIANVTAGNCPTSPSTSGDWVPPTMAMTTGGRVMITHPGYDGVTNFIGWLDVSSFSLGTLTGSTHSSTLIDTMSSSPILAGVQPGMKIAGAGIPANTYVVSLTATSITLSQAATATAAGVALTFTGGTPAAPLYGAGNVNGNPFTSVPLAVALFNTRAWYAVSNYAVYSDLLNPTQVSAASQALRIGDNLPITALAGLPLTSQVNGGTLQSLIAFKGAQSYVQITGDAALNTLQANTVAGSVGTLAPNTLCPTPQGLAFISIDGLRIIGLDGVEKPAIGNKGQGINVPFTQAVNASRMSAAYNNHVVRTTVQNPFASGSQYQEYWYDMDMGIWTGPHTSTTTLVEAYFGDVSGVGNFIHTLQGVNAKLFTSYSEPTTTSSYTENSVGLTWVWQSTLTPDNEEGVMNALGAQSTIACQLPTGEVISVLLTDENGNLLDTETVNGPSASGTIWGSSNWGALPWGYSTQAFQQVAIDWNQPNIFKQMTVQMNGASMGGLKLGDLRFDVQPLRYMIP
jgi:hypothetical protein